MNRNDYYGDVLEVGAPDVEVKDATASVKTADVPFLTVENGYVHSSPLGGGAFFNYAELENNVQQVFARSPAAPFTDTEAEGGGITNNTITIVDIQTVNPNNTAVLIPFLIVQFSAPQLNQIPAGVISVDVTIPTEFNGNAVYSAIQVGISKVTNRLNLVVVPYILVQSKPRPVLGLIRAGSDVVVAASGLATGTRTSVIVPGSTHPAIRRSALYGRQ